MVAVHFWLFAETRAIRKCWMASHFNKNRRSYTLHEFKVQLQRSSVVQRGCGIPIKFWSFPVTFDEGRRSKVSRKWFNFVFKWLEFRTGTLFVCWRRMFCIKCWWSYYFVCLEKKPWGITQRIKIKNSYCGMSKVVNNFLWMSSWREKKKMVNHDWKVFFFCWH